MLLIFFLYRFFFFFLLVYWSPNWPWADSMLMIIFFDRLYFFFFLPLLETCSAYTAGMSLLFAECGYRS